MHMCFKLIKNTRRSSWRYYRLTIDWFWTFRDFAGFMCCLVTCLGFLLRCNRLTYLDGDKMATVYRRSHHKNERVMQFENYKPGICLGVDIYWLIQIFCSIACFYFHWGCIAFHWVIGCISLFHWSMLRAL